MKHQIQVGIFVVIGLIVLTVSIFILGSNKSYFQNSYRIYSYFDTVQGLNKGAIVSLAGFKVGNVETIDFDETKNLVKVIFVIDEQFAKKIKIDSVVEMRTQGALGDKFLYITPGQESGIISDQTELKSEYGHDILSVINKRGSESERIFDMLSDLHKVIKSISDQNKIPSILNKLDQTTSHLNDSSLKIKQALSTGHLENSLSKLDNILEKIDNGHGSLGALINDRSIHERLKSILGAGQKQQQVKSILKSSVDDE